MGKKKQEPEPFSHRPFRTLGHMLQGQKDRVQKPLPQIRKPAAKSDDDLFREAMEEVHEIREFRELAVPKGIKPLPPRKRQATDETLHELEEIVAGKKAVRLSDTQEYIEWVNPGYHREIVKELHLGRFAVQDYIDLHGYVLEDAVTVMHDFMLEARRRGFHCVKIIHGRGLRSPNGPVLKRAVIALLTTRYRKYIIGFSTARPNDGGLGALYVLLK
jgi:DNA-nicking Smr family endonuclease